MKVDINSSWDKTFPKDESVEYSKVSFTNRFGINLVADLYKPKGATGKLIGIAISGPYGANKEQCSGLYAQKLASMGFLTIAFDPSFTGESSGFPRNIASVDINTEDFQAAVDYLISRDDVDQDKICILGICGWGGMALNTASIDTRIKVTITSTMYNMSRVSHYGYFDAYNEEEIYKMKEELNEQRNIDYKNHNYKRTGGVVDPLPEDAPFFVKDYYDYYRTERGYHPRSLNSTEGFNLTSSLSLINTPSLTYISEIRSAVLVIHGEKAHSVYFSKDTFKELKGDNKKLLLIKDAVHTDLYDKVDVIPFEEIKDFIYKHV